MIGAIVGDIVGSVYEFDNIKTKDFTLFADYHGDKCGFTDDTVMTLAIAEALMRSKPDWSDLAVNTERCMHEIGRHYPDCGYGERFGMWMFLDGAAPYHSYGNGAAMRVSPVAYAASGMEEALMLSDIVTSVTHGHPEGMKGARATAACVYLALQGSSKAEIKWFVEKSFYSLDFTLDEIRPSYRFNETCQRTVPQAIQAFLESSSFEDAIRNAVSLGGDSDTLAAICGGIAGAYYGVPREMVSAALNLLTDELRGIVSRFGDWLQITRKAY